MTTLTDYRAYYEVLERVDEVQARLRRLRIAEGIFALLAVACAAMLLATLAQGYLRFGPAGRLALLLVAGLTAGFAFWRTILTALRDDLNEKQVARYLEMHLPELGNSLINTILLAERADEWSPVLVERALGEAAAAAHGVDLTAALSPRRAKRRAVAAAAAGFLLGVFVVAEPGRFFSAAMQVLLPFSKVPSVGNVQILSVRPGNIVLAQGEPLEIEAVIADPKGRLYEGFFEWTEPAFAEAAAGGEVLRKPLLRDAARPDRFTYRIPQVLRSFDYRLNVGGTETRFFTVTLRRPPLIERIDLAYTYPDYTGLAPQTLSSTGGDIQCPIGTAVAMTLRLSAPAEAASLLFAGGPILKCLPSEDGRALSAHFTVLRNDTYQVRFGGRTPDGAAVAYRVVALEDPPPTIQWTIPARDLAAAPGDSVKLSLKAADRYGLGEVRLLAQSDTDPAPAVVAAWNSFADPKEAILDYAFPVEAARYPRGRSITYWAEAADRRTYQGGDTPKGPNVTTSAKFKILVEDPKAVAESKLEALSRLFDRLRQILAREELARQATDAVAGLEALEAIRAAGSDVAQVQRTIRRDTSAVVAEVTFDADTMPLRETLEVLAANEMTSAVTRADAVAALEDAARLPALGRALAADQDVILAVLRRILDIVPKLTDAVRDAEKRLAPSDLPPDTLAQLKALRDRLKEFMDEQKKVIEASQELAKRPVDDFQDADQRALDELKAVEDRWDAFLTETVADFSKIPAVDASNPTLLKELIEVKTDVEMAAGALARKAVEIAVPLEELGMEGAEEIVENLERWLPDTPDRERWKQEESTAEMEVPHAELPAQLEDLVGQLFEQEEDLFEDMEDTTSGAADSPDKGAGWDAMDGPISSFTAKGITGNRLPNSSEISGRSGEGRSGKASGEFVEEEAAGKGGRRTPTRLAPDAFSQGEVKDSSRESTGGATGGGKVSGGGGEGLEGPVPPELQRRMGNLAGRQAQLRNKADGVNAALRISHYESFTLDEAVDGMRRVQRDLLAGRYRSALRQKDVILDNLRGTRMLVSGELRIRRDTGASIPDEVRQGVFDALEKPMPRGYETYLKRYYERLTETP